MFHNNQPYSPSLMRTPPPVLYHYTNSAGLMGIVGNSEIWCTHTQYLNDTQEFCHALDLFRSMISLRKKQPGAPVGALESILQQLNTGIEGLNVCVTSFSEDRDSLSQWRAYGSAPGSFAIGFKSEQLSLSARAINGSLAACIYGEDEQFEAISEALDIMLEKESGPDIMSVLCRICPLLKHPAFKSEREWRIITPVMSSYNERFHFRPGASMLIPFYKLAIADIPASMPLAELVVGPTPNPKQSSHSAMLFLAKYDLAELPITHSSSPYRSW